MARKTTYLIMALEYNGNEGPTSGLENNSLWTKKMNCHGPRRSQVNHHEPINLQQKRTSNKRHITIQTLKGKLLHNQNQL